MAQDYTAVPYEANDESQRSAIVGLFAMVWRHKWLLALGLAVGVIIGVLYTSQLAPEYQSSLKLLIIKKRPEALPGSDPRNALVEDFLATHQVVIRSPVIILSAVRKMELESQGAIPEKPEDATTKKPKETNTEKPEDANTEKPEDATTKKPKDANTKKPEPASSSEALKIGEILKTLTVTREATEGGATNILNLSFRAPVADDCPRVLKAVVGSYKDFLGGTYQEVSDETLKLITTAKKLLGVSKAKTEAEYTKFRLDPEHPGLVRGKDGTNIRQERLLSIEIKRSALLVRKFEIDARVNVIEEGLRSGQDMSKLLAMAAEMYAKPRNDREDSLASLLLQEQSLLEDFGPDHPQVKAVRKRIETTRADYSIKSDERPIDPVQRHLAELKRELVDVTISEQALSTFLQKEQTNAKKMIFYELEDERLRREIANQQLLFDGIVNRLNEINLINEGKLGGYNVRELAEAGPAWQVGPRTVPIFLVASFLGLVAGMGLAYLAEVTDQSFRNPEEIRRRLGMQIVGQIPVVSIESKAVRPIKEKHQSLAPILCTFHHPKSRNAEAYRGVRTGLFFSTQGKGHKVIQVTSPSAGDGKSTLAANLAISIAQAEKRVLLVDADFRRPTIHTLFGVSHERGLASVLLGEAELADVIQPSGIANLSVLPCGPIPANPAELLSLPRFKELLDYIRDQYDFVIIDTPPILAVTDPCMVVPLADGVLLTLRPSKQAQPAAVCAKEVLATLDATMIGVVVNAVADQKAGYGYGNYGYGYGYGYGGGDKYYQHQESTASGTGKSAK